MKSKKIIFLYTIISLFILTSCVQKQKQEETEENTETTYQPTYEVDRDFLNAYMSGNQASADQKYKDQKFLVKGMISSITNMYEPIVKVETEVGEVDCVFDKSQLSELANLSVAQNIEIECTFRGMFLSARFNDCKIIN